MTSVDTSPDLSYFIDETGTIGTLNTVTGEIKKIVSLGIQFTDIAMSHTGQLYVSTGNEIYKVDLPSGALTRAFDFTGDIVNYVTAMEFAPDGTLHVHGLNGVRVVLDASLTRQIEDIQTNAISTGDVLINGAGKEFLSSIDYLRQIGNDHGSTATYLGEFQTAYGLSYDKDGNIDIFSGSYIYKLDVSTGQMTVLVYGNDVSSPYINGATSINDTSPAITTQPPSTVTPDKAIADFAAHQIASPIFIRDASTNIVKDLDGLQAIAAAHDIATITFVDFLIPPVLSITATQLVADRDALAAIHDVFSLSVTFDGNASRYEITPVGDGFSLNVTDTGTGKIVADHASGITALKFADTTALVTPHPIAGGGATTGNIAELYAAALDRQPDVVGLGYYQSYLTQHPNTPLMQFAQFFLASPEYTASHNYARNAAGDVQFITDSYNNLLHRGPEAGAVEYYQAVVNQFTKGFVPGTADYAAAQTLGHALVLTYFSSSPEFLNDVQITAQHPADAQHWLLLV